MMRFYGFFRSSAAYRCRIAFNLKGVQPEVTTVNLRDRSHKSPEYLAMNPQGLVPILNTGTAKLAQSLAIIEWLDETRPGPRLLPEDATLRAQVRGFAQVIACEIHPLQNVRVLNYIKSEYGQDQDGADAWCRHWIAEGLAACEAIAAGQDHGGAFIFGDAPGLAEICLVPQMFSADRFGLSTDAYPRLQAVRAACERLPAFADAHPSRQPDAV